MRERVKAITDGRIEKVSLDFFLTNLIPETTLSAFDEREAGPQKSE